MLKPVLGNVGYVGATYMILLVEKAYTHSKPSPKKHREMIGD